LHGQNIQIGGTIKSLFRAKAAKKREGQKIHFAFFAHFATFARPFQNGLAMISNGGHNAPSILN
jgi:hypothetical protein